MVLGFCGVVLSGGGQGSASHITRNNTTTSATNTNTLPFSPNHHHTPTKQTYLRLEGELGHLAAQARQEALLVQRTQRVQVLSSSLSSSSSPYDCVPWVGGCEWVCVCRGNECCVGV